MTIPVGPVASPAAGGAVGFDDDVVSVAPGESVTAGLALEVGVTSGDELTSATAVGVGVGVAVGLAVGLGVARGVGLGVAAPRIVKVRQILGGSGEGGPPILGTTQTECGPGFASFGTAGTTSFTLAAQLWYPSMLMPMRSHTSPGLMPGVHVTRAPK